MPTSDVYHLLTTLTHESTAKDQHLGYLGLVGDALQDAGHPLSGLFHHVFHNPETHIGGRLSQMTPQENRKLDIHYRGERPRAIDEERPGYLHYFQGGPGKPGAFFHVYMEPRTKPQEGVGVRVNVSTLGDEHRDQMHHWTVPYHIAEEAARGLGNDGGPYKENSMEDFHKRFKDGIAPHYAEHLKLSRDDLNSSDSVAVLRSLAQEPDRAHGLLGLLGDTIADNHGPDHPLAAVLHHIFHNEELHPYNHYFHHVAESRAGKTPHMFVPGNPNFHLMLHRPIRHDEQNVFYTGPKLDTAGKVGALITVSTYNDQEKQHDLRQHHAFIPHELAERLADHVGGEFKDNFEHSIGRVKRAAPDLKLSRGTDSGALAIARSYAAKKGIQLDETPSNLTINPELSKAAAAFYGKARSQPEHPRIKEAYDALKSEVKDQYDHLVASGVKMEPWTKDGQPYTNSREMRADATAGHLWFFPTKSGFGTSAEGSARHPLDEKVPGTELVYNDLFRAVHDYFGHAVHGHEFGPKGELRAWHEHAKMFSPLARRAMTAETHGQNSWVNFGPHSDKPVLERPYADQKATMLPRNVVPDVKLSREYEVARDYIHRIRAERDTANHAWHTTRYPDAAIFDTLNNRGPDGLRIQVHPYVNRRLASHESVSSVDPDRFRVQVWQRGEGSSAVFLTGDQLADFAKIVKHPGLDSRLHVWKVKPKTDTPTVPSEMATAKTRETENPLKFARSKGPLYGYHITHSDHLEDIAREGLVPGGKGAEISRGSLQDLHRKRGVFFTNHPDGIKRWAGQLEKPAVLRFKYDPLDVVGRDHHAWEGNMNFYLPRAVQPADIELWHEGTWKPVGAHSDVSVPPSVPATPYPPTTGDPHRKVVDSVEGTNFYRMKPEKKAELLAKLPEGYVDNYSDEGFKRTTLPDVKLARTKAPAGGTIVNNQFHGGGKFLPKSFQRIRRVRLAALSRQRSAEPDVQLARTRVPAGDAAILHNQIEEHYPQPLARHLLGDKLQDMGDHRAIIAYRGFPSHEITYPMINLPKGSGRQLGTLSSSLATLDTPGVDSLTAIRKGLGNFKPIVHPLNADTMTDEASQESHSENDYGDEEWKSNEPHAGYLALHETKHNPDGKPWHEQKPYPVLAWAARNKANDNWIALHAPVSPKELHEFIGGLSRKHQTKWRAFALAKGWLPHDNELPHRLKSQEPGWTDARDAEPDVQLARPEETTQHMAVHVTQLDKAQQFYRALTGKELDHNLLARAFGGVPGANVSIWPGFTAELNNPTITGAVSLRDPANPGKFLLTTTRTLKREGDKLVMYHGTQMADPSYRGNGAERFYAALKAMREVGVHKIKTTATGSKRESGEYTGYYAWPRMGFNAPLRAHHKLWMPMHLSGAQDFHELMSTPEGRDAWREHGNDVNVEFDTHPDSPHSKFLMRYLHERANAKGNRGTAPAPGAGTEAARGGQGGTGGTANQNPQPPAVRPQTDLKFSRADRRARLHAIRNLVSLLRLKRGDADTPINPTGHQHSWGNIVEATGLDPKQERFTVGQVRKIEDHFDLAPQHRLTVHQAGAQDTTPIKPPSTDHIKAFLMGIEKASSSRPPFPGETGAELYAASHLLHTYEHGNAVTNARDWYSHHVSAWEEATRAVHGPKEDASDIWGHRDPKTKQLVRGDEPLHHHAPGISLAKMLLAFTSGALEPHKNAMQAARILHDAGKVAHPDSAAFWASLPVYQHNYFNEWMEDVAKKNNTDVDTLRKIGKHSEDHQAAYEFVRDKLGGRKFKNTDSGFNAQGVRGYKSRKVVVNKATGKVVGLVNNAKCDWLEPGYEKAVGNKINRYTLKPFGLFAVDVPLLDHKGEPMAKSWTMRSSVPQAIWTLKHLVGESIDRHGGDVLKGTRDVAKYLTEPQEDAEHARRTAAVKERMGREATNYDLPIPSLKVSRDYLPKGEKVPGSFLFGPKFGSFFQNLHLNDPNPERAAKHGHYLTADMWWTREFKHGTRGLIKDMLGADAPNNTKEWTFMASVARRAAKELNVPVALLQAVLWYTTQRVYRMLGAKASSSSYLDGANNVLEAFKHPGRLGADGKWIARK